MDKCPHIIYRNLILVLLSFLDNITTVSLRLSPLQNVLVNDCLGYYTYLR